MRRRRVGLAAGVTAFLAIAIPVDTQQQPPPQRATGTLQEGVRAVLVDVVVRDRRGQPVRDLTQADFELLEDGVAQPIGSFSPMFAAAAPVAPATPAAPAPAAPAVGAATPPIAAGPAITALVFDRLQPESRRRAAQAARNYLGTKEESNDYVAVFGIDLSLMAFVPFTRNAVAIRKALDAMVTSASAGYTSPETRQAIADATQLAAAASQNAAGAIAGATGPGATAGVGAASVDAKLTGMQASIVQGFEGMDRDQQGYATTNGLFSIVNTLARVPGRKSIVLFSEGISIPPAVHRFYLGVIDAANRGNVSIYTMDAAGLRSESDLAMIRDSVNMQGAFGINGYATDAAGGAYTKMLENNEYNLRKDPAYALNELSSSTGGLFFGSTNNLRPAFDRVESDQHNYYLLGYTPTNTTYDGKFRKIEVRVKRENITVASRKGYFAVRDPGGVPVNEWEAPALGALEQKPVGNAFPIRAGALLFPERGRPGLVPVVVDLKTAPLTFQAAPDGKTYTSDFTVLVRFVDQQNAVTRKVSQHYEIRGPIDQIERAKQGDVIFYRDSELPTGLYTMEAIVYDALSGKSSVRFSTVDVRKQDDNALRMSSLVLVKRTEKVAEKDRPAGNPLLVKDVILHPNLGDPVSKASKELGFYYTIYPAPGLAPPEASIELMLNGKLVAQVPMAVPAADSAGRVQQVGRLPLDQLAPGTYDMRVVVRQGTTQVSQSAIVRIVD